MEWRTAAIITVVKKSRMQGKRFRNHITLWGVLGALSLFVLAGYRFAWDGVGNSADSIPNDVSSLLKPKSTGYATVRKRRFLFLCGKTPWLRFWRDGAQRCYEELPGRTAARTRGVALAGFAGVFFAGSSGVLLGRLGFVRGS